MDVNVSAAISGFGVAVKKRGGWPGHRGRSTERRAAVATKRVLDVVGACVLLLLLAPLFALIAVAVAVGSRGPVFYAHRRLVQFGDEARILKFRTMRTATPDGRSLDGLTPAEALAALGRPDLVAAFDRDQKVREDPRVTAVGAFLRRTSLDELPQLVNVLRGHISLVGPRPIVEEELERYDALREPFLQTKPGLTGLWQVSGRNTLSYDARVDLDRHYIENWNLGLDMKILLRTVVVVVTRHGAY